jgi:hypothetical protein
MKTIEQLHAELVQPTADLARLPHGRPISDPENLIEQCDLFLYPVTIHERHLYLDEFVWGTGGDELQFEQFVVGKRRIAYFQRQIASRGILGGEHE